MFALTIQIPCCTRTRAAMFRVKQWHWSSSLTKRQSLPTGFPAATEVFLFCSASSPPSLMSLTRGSYSGVSAHQIKNAWRYSPLPSTSSWRGTSLKTGILPYMTLLICMADLPVCKLPTYFVHCYTEGRILIFSDINNAITGF